MMKDRNITATSHMSLVRRMWRHLGSRRRQQVALLFGLMLLGACAEVISLGSVAPFIMVLSAPEQLLRHQYVADLATAVGVATPEGLTLAITALFAIAALFAGAVRLLLLWANTRLAFAVGEDFGAEIYRLTIYQPYQVHVALNSSRVITTITKKVGSSVTALMSFLTLASSGVLVTAIMFALVAVSPLVALVAAACLGVSYGIVMLMFRYRLRANSRRSVQ
jgi:ATP-binding cassette subfamily B protein